MGKGDRAEAGLLRRVARRGADFPRLGDRRQRVLALGLTLTVLTGVLLGFLTYRIARSNEQKRIHLLFREIVHREASALEGEIDELTEVLYSFRALYESSDRVDPGEFETFAAGPLRRHPAIRAVAWVPESPEVAAPTVAAVQPTSNPELPLGFDLRSRPAYDDVIHRAATGGHAVVSDPVAEPGDHAQQVLMVVPVSGKGGARGLAALLFRPDELTGAGIHRRGDMELALVALDRDGNEHALVRSRDFERGRWLEVAIGAGSREWSFRAYPTPAYLARWSTPNPVLFGVVAAALWLGLAGVLILGSRIGRERELRRRDRNVRTVLSSLEEGVIVADRDGHVVFANGAAGRILAIRPDHALAGRCAATWGCHHDEAGTRCPEEALPLARALEGDTVPPTHLYVTNRHLPRGRWVSMSAGPLRDGKGGLSGAVAVLRDVTDVRRGQARQIEMRLASEVQRRLYPRAAPQIEGYDLAGAVFSADATCGDYFDFVSISDRVVAIVIGDVSGHGLGPALVMTQVRAYLRAFAQTMDDPARIVERMNRVLVEDLYEGYFVTLLVAFLDIPTGRLRYVNAGHVAGQVLDSSGERRATLDRTGLPLGLVGDHRYAHRDVELAEGDTLMLMTDGLIECRNDEGEFLWDDGAVRIAGAHVAEPASDLVESVYERVRAHAAWQPLADDLALVVLKALPAGESAPRAAAIHRERAPGTTGTIVHRAR